MDKTYDLGSIGKAVEAVIFKHEQDITIDNLKSVIESMSDAESNHNQDGQHGVRVTVEDITFKNCYVTSCKLTRSRRV
jgi:hypothetical protein